MGLDTEFIPVTAIFCGISFALGFISCSYRVKKLIESNNKSATTESRFLSDDPMIFRFDIMQNMEYVLNVKGMEGRHLTKENHKKFMEVLKFVYENEKLRPFPKAHKFKLLTFEKKE